MALPQDGVVRRKLARERRVAWRVLNTVFVAEKLLTGQIDKDAACVEIRGVGDTGLTMALKLGCVIYECWGEAES